MGERGFFHWQREILFHGGFAEQVRAGGRVSGDG